MLSNPSLFLLTVYGFLLLGISVKSAAEKKERTFADYMIADRQVALLGTVASLTAGYRDGAGIAVWVLLAYQFRLGAIWLYFGLAFGLIVLSVLAPRLRVMAESRHYITIGDLLRDVLGTKTARLCSGIVLASSFLYAGAQLFVAGRIFADLLNVSGNLGIVATASIISLYLMIGGYSTVIKTDVLQWGFIMVIVATPFMVRGFEVSWSDLSTVGTVGFGPALSMFSVGAVFSVANPDVWQRIFSARSARLARISFLTASGVYFLICAGLILFGLAIHTALGGGDAETAFLDIFTSDQLPTWGLSFFAVFAVAATMSTLDTQVFLFSSTLTRDFLAEGAQEDHPRTVRRSRLTVAVLLGFLALIAMTIEDLVAFVFEAASLVTVLGPVLLYAATRETRSRTAKQDGVLMVGLMVTTAVYCLMFVSGALGKMSYFCIPAAVSLLVCALSHYGWRIEGSPGEAKR